MATLVKWTYSLGVYGETNVLGLKIAGTLPPVLRGLHGRNRLRGIDEFETPVGKLEKDVRSAWKGSVRVTASLDYIDKIPSRGRCCRTAPS
jgi:hypothetical protein